ncbi:hypothetical protein PAXRUDRAFT_19019 [Paxillus rubicundulus Ve08.2h10]|uniref:Uncharacterized protein n=1 Tax=Paxillus rubicundulus Ve08.2h10 TaxID=930991 RepID=A0A0D0CWG7_9AGAM|nr:hypothetical protein PAXRUDRAFT_19019 [Paxillus rubicundulus Ve08.2h10]
MANPYELEIPNYTSIESTEAQAMFTADRKSNTKAALILANVWHFNNAHICQLWDRQQEDLEEARLAEGVCLAELKGNGALKTDGPKPKKVIPKPNDWMQDIPKDNTPVSECFSREDSTLKEDTPDSTFMDDSSLKEDTQKQHLPKQLKEGTQKGGTPQDQGSGVPAEQPEIVYCKFVGGINEKTWFATFPCAKAPKRKTPDHGAVDIGRLHVDVGVS